MKIITRICTALFIVCLTFVLYTTTIHFPEIQVSFSDTGFINSNVTYVLRENSLLLYASAIHDISKLDMYGDYLVRKHRLSLNDKIRISKLIRNISAESEMSSETYDIKSDDFIEVMVSDEIYKFKIRIPLESRNELWIPKNMENQAKLAVLFATINEAPRTYTTPILGSYIRLNETPNWISEKKRQGGVVIRT